MRPIDADALTEFLKCLLPERGMWEIEGDTGKNAVCETVAEAIEMVKNMETIHPEKAQLSCDGTTKGTTSDTISRQVAIDRINSIRPVSPKESDYRQGVDVGMAMSIVAIKEQPSAQPEPQWVPVSERLPEESGCYIITAYDGVGHRTTFAKFQKKAKSWDLTGARSYWKVIAWMPLPEPYQKGAIK